MKLAEGRVLVVVESEGTARDWSRHLREGDRLLATGGHVLQLAPAPKAAQWPPPRAPAPGQGAVLQRLRRLAGQVDAVALATDGDREGERIAADLAQTLRPGAIHARVHLPATPSTEGLLSALSRARAIDARLADASLVRATFDALLVGRLRPLLGGDTLGRVQAAALGALVEEEAAREQAPSIVRIAVAGLEALLIDEAGEPARFDAGSAAVLAEAAPRTLTLVTLEAMPAEPAAALTTAALLARAGRDLGLPVERVLERLVALARGVLLDGRTVRLVSYPRTDAAGAAGGPGHGALEPLPGAPSPAELRGRIDEGARRVYARVWAAAEARRAPGGQVVLTLEDGATRFRAEGRLDPRRLERLRPGQRLRAARAEAVRLGGEGSEAALVERLEALGVGRPSTLAAAVGSLQRRGLASRERGELTTTPRGSALHERVARVAPLLLGAAVTRALERVLGEVERGERAPRDALAGPLELLLPAARAGTPLADGASRCSRCGRAVATTRPGATGGLAGSRRFPCWNCMHLP